MLYSPNWGKAATHPYNYRFIEAIISAVSALPVSSRSSTVSGFKLVTQTAGG
jgi:hypothetical protein